VVSYRLRQAYSRRARRRKPPIRRAPDHTASGSRNLAMAEGHTRLPSRPSWVSRWARCPILVSLWPHCRAAPSLSHHAGGRGQAITADSRAPASKPAVVSQVDEGVNLPVGAVTVAGLVIWEARPVAAIFPILPVRKNHKGITRA
jgi:hypothetical protein